MKTIIIICWFAFCMCLRPALEWLFRMLRVTGKHRRKK